MKTTCIVKNTFAGFATIALAIVVSTLSVTGCKNPADPPKSTPQTSNDSNNDGNMPAVINIAAIQGVTVPVNGEIPVTRITESSQYSGTVTWNGNPVAFAASTQYTATITLTAKTGYTLQGVAANFFTVAGAATVSNSANSGVITAVFPATAVTNITSVSIIIIAPVKGETPKTTASTTGNFTIDTVSWSPTDNPFLSDKVYTASVTLTANSGYTFTGLNSATINGQSANVSNNTGLAVTLSHTFPATNTKTVTNIAIKTQPTRLTYTHGDTLDLAGLVVTLTYDDNITTEDIAAASFAAKNVTTTPSAGNTLVYSMHNGQSVKISFGDLTCNTNNLNIIPLINAVEPVISTQPQGGTFFKIGTLSVTASVTDRGTLTYQWYRNAANSTSGGTAITGATGSNYTLSDTGIYYYYVVITNTIANNGDGGAKTAQTTSNVVAVTIELVLAEWARSVSAGSNSNTSRFYAVTVDSFGNVYAAGFQTSNYIYTYGTGVFAQGASSSNSYGHVGNVVLVKYNSSGTAQWAKTVSTGSNFSNFNAVAVDSYGNVYAAGYQCGNGAYTYGTDVSARGTYSGNNNSGYNVVLVKYDSSGTALWARTVSGGGNGSQFKGVAVDSFGNVYAAGYQVSNGIYTYGTGVSAQGTYNDAYGGNVVLVKYDTDGTALWARTVSTGNSDSFFNTVAVDSSGNVYAAGFQDNAYTYTYGTGVSAQVDSIFNNIVLVKYDSNGTAQWARTVSTRSNISKFYAVTVDSFGNIYAAGTQYGTGIYTYGTGVSAQGICSNGNNVVLVKYNSSGTAQWAQTVSAGSVSEFNAVAADSSGSVYAAGYQMASHIYTYGTGVSITGNGGGTLVKYDSNGNALWARVGGSNFSAVAVDSSGNIYAAGNQSGNGMYTYGTGVSAQGTYSDGFNVVLVKYKEE